MSKGSKQRPGTGYADGWDRIFGGRKEECAHQRATYGDPWVCVDCGFVGPSPFNKPPTGVYAIKANPEFTGTITLPNQTCGNCRHYVKEYSWFECTNEVVAKMAKADAGPSFEPPADFGCNRFEAKP